MKIKPLGTKVLLEVLNPETKTESGLFIPQTAQEKTQQGIVLELGEDDAFSVKAGDKVMYDKYAGTSVKLDGKDCLVLEEDDIIAVVEE